MSGMDIQSLLMIAVLVCIPISLSVFIIRRRMNRTIDARIRAASKHLLHDFLLPDGNEGEIHFEYALLTPMGILVVDTKDIEGNVFGSDAMDDWTVINDHRRHTFSNPQRGLLDRIAAIKAFADVVPVEGYVAFTDSARFSKGQPSMVVFFDTLIDELNGSLSDKSISAVDAFLPTWDLLVSQATVKGVAKALIE